MIGDNGEPTSIMFVFLKYRTNLIGRYTGAWCMAAKMVLMSYEFHPNVCHECALSEDRTELVAYGVNRRCFKEGSLSQACSITNGVLGVVSLIKGYGLPFTVLVDWK